MSVLPEPVGAATSTCRPARISGQAWACAEPLQGPTDLYDSDWLSDIQAIGAENYYPHDPW